MEKKIINNLINFGLSDKEARIYVTLLELELASVSEVAKQSEVKRSSAYVVLESLKKRGLVGVSDDRRIQRYFASSPDILLNITKEATEKQETINEIVKATVPELKSLYKDSKHKPIIKVYEGKEAAKQIYLSSVRDYPETSEIRVYEDPEGYLDILPEFVKSDYTLRKKRGIYMQAIFPASEESKSVIKEYKALGSKDEMIQIPKNKFMSSKQFSSMTVCGDEVWFDSLKDGYCISIKKQEIANTLKHVFDLAKEEAKRLNKRI